jgi:hypothetical protein
MDGGVGEGPGQQRVLPAAPAASSHGGREAAADATAAEVRGHGQERQLGRAVIVGESQAVEAARVVVRPRPIPRRPAGQADDVAR